MYRFSRLDQELQALYNPAKMNDANGLTNGEKHRVTGDGASRLATGGHTLDDPLKWPQTYRLVGMKISPDLKIVRHRTQQVTFPVQGPGGPVYITREVPIR